MQYLVSVIDDGAGRATPTEEADIDAFNEGCRPRGTGSSPADSGQPTQPLSSTTGVRSQ